MTHVLNAKPLVSILCPSRGRPESFMQMQDTLQDVMEDVELLVALDENDLTVPDYLAARFTRFFIRKRQWLTYRVNELAINAKGSFLMWGNDDMRFTGPEWVDIVRTYDPEVPAVIGFRAGYHKQKHFPFPILTRAAYRRIGYFAPEQFRGVFADTWLYDIGRRAGCLHYRGDYYIEHLHWSDNTRARDATDKDKSMRGQASDRALFNELADERQKIAERLQSDQ